MSSIKLYGVALTVLLTVLVGRSYADLIIETDAAGVSGSGLTSADYTLTPSGVAFNSNLVPNNQKISVTMYVYADVLDMNGNIANYSTKFSQDGQTYLQAINNGLLPGQGNDTGSDPFVNVGIQEAALSFSQTSNGSTVIAGSMTATPNSTGFSFEHKSGSSTSTTLPNGIGFGSNVGNYFYAQTTNYDPTSTDSGFSFLSYSSSNGATNAGTQLNLTTINGKTYDKICLGKLTYTFTDSASLAGNSVSVSANPAASVGGKNYFLWMEDGTIYAGASDIAHDPIGTINTAAPATISLVTPNLAISPTTTVGDLRVMVGSTKTVDSDSLVTPTTGTLYPEKYALTSSGSDALTISPVSGTVANKSTKAVPFTFGWTNTGTAGAQTGEVTFTGSTTGNTTLGVQTLEVSGAVLNNRVLTAGSLTTSGTRMLAGSVVTTTISSGSDPTVDGDSYATRVSTVSTGTVSGKGLTFTYDGTPLPTFDGVSQSAALNVTAGSKTGLYSATVNLAKGLLADGESETKAYKVGATLLPVNLSYTMAVLTPRTLSVGLPATRIVGTALSGGTTTMTVTSARGRMTIMPPGSICRPLPSPPPTASRSSMPAE